MGAKTSTRGQVHVYLCGKRHLLCYNFEAMAQLNERFGNKTAHDLFFGGRVSHMTLLETLRIGLMKFETKEATRLKVSNKLDKMLIEEPDAKVREENYRQVLQAVYRGIAEAEFLDEEDIQRFLKLLDPDEEMDVSETEAAKEVLGNSQGDSTVTGVVSSSVAESSTSL